MIKSELDLKIEQLARSFQQKDRRLSWETAKRRAIQNLRLFRGGCLEAESD
uniref:Uncharacterized protein n=1 Tax=Shewanella putrefaciens (strain 200) TaxID=399804 RepID=E6XG68_SHEP2